MEEVTVSDIHGWLKGIGGWGNIYIPEFTFDGMRIDGILIDVKTRWIRGYEIKVSRADFLSDEKWMNYTEFCSSLSVVCPEGLIEKHEIQKPFGLIYATKNNGLRHVKKAKRFQTREGYAWHYTYMRVIEREFPRLMYSLAATEQKLFETTKRLTHP